MNKTLWRYVQQQSGTASTIQKFPKYCIDSEVSSAVTQASQTIPNSTCIIVRACRHVSGTISVWHWQYLSINKCSDRQVTDRQTHNESYNLHVKGNIRFLVPMRLGSPTFYCVYLLHREYQADCGGLEGTSQGELVSCITCSTSQRAAWRSVSNSSSRQRTNKEGTLMLWFQCQPGRNHPNCLEGCRGYFHVTVHKSLQEYRLPKQPSLPEQHAESEKDTHHVLFYLMV